MNLLNYFAYSFVIGSFIYIAQALSDKITRPSLEIDIVTQPLDIRDTISEREKRTGVTFEPKNYLMITKKPQHTLNEMMDNIQEDYSPVNNPIHQVPYDGIYVSDTRQYDNIFVDK